MRNKQQYSAVVLWGLGIIAAGLTGCGSKQPAATTPEQVTAFAGDPTKMPASYKARISALQNGAVAQQRASEMQKAAQK